MEPTRTPIDATALLAEAGWVRRLALRLVRDHAAAEDVVQETWLAALKQPAPADGRLRPWLARVALNFARRSRRSDGRRAAREILAARPERVPPASEALERLEAQRLLVEAIAALAEPCRMTVILRHIDGLSAEAIARRQGVPAGTVRWRLKKGVDELRARLDGRFGGDRGAWAFAFVPLLRDPPLGALAGGASAAVHAAVAGGLAMNAMTKGVLATATFGVWIAVDRARDEIAPPQAEAPVPLPAAQVAAAVEPDVAPLASGGRAPADLPLAQPDGSPADPVPSVAAPATLQARFLDRFDRPVRGVRVTLPPASDLELPRARRTGVSRPRSTRARPVSGTRPTSSRRAPATRRGPARSSSSAAGRRSWATCGSSRAARSPGAFSRRTGCPRAAHACSSRRPRSRPIRRSCACADPGCPPPDPTRRRAPAAPSASTASVPGSCARGRPTPIRAGSRASRSRCRPAGCARASRSGSSRSRARTRSRASCSRPMARPCRTRTCATAGTARRARGRGTSRLLRTDASGTAYRRAARTSSWRATRKRVGPTRPRPGSSPVVATSCCSSRRSAGSRSRCTRAAAPRSTSSPRP